MSIGTIICRHNGQYIETISDVDLQPGLLVMPTTDTTDVGNLGLKIVPNTSTILLGCWVVMSRVYGDAEQENILDHPVYAAGELVRLAILCGGSSAYIRSDDATLITGSYLNTDAVNPGYVVTNPTFFRLVAVDNYADGFIKALCV